MEHWNALVKRDGRRRVPGTIVIVEDEPDLGALLGDVLETVGYSAVLTTSGRAVEVIQEADPIAIVTDYMMPGMNGAEVVQRIRQVMLESAPPVILVTGLQNAAELAASLGAKAYLRKPFDMDDLISAVQQVSGAVA
ncbi:MAG TPA: response regulator [Chloroflexota bacterium]